MTSLLNTVEATSLKVRVITTEKNTGKTIAVMEGEDFLKAVKAPQTQFLADAIEEYNKSHPDMEAKMEVLVSKRGKWKSLGASDAVSAAGTKKVTMFTTAIKNKYQVVLADSGWNKKTLDSYLETLLWSSMDDNGEHLDKNYSPSDISLKAIKETEEDIKKFYSMAEKAGIEVEKYTPSEIGHDFWLTRNGHGAGFWDGDYDDNDGKTLTSISEHFGQKDPYVGDDGKIYLG